MPPEPPGGGRKVAGSVLPLEHARAKRARHPERQTNARMGPTAARACLVTAEASNGRETFVVWLDPPRRGRD
jgi:hypothetical protein